MPKNQNQNKSQNQNLKRYLLAFLLFSVVSSKGIIIYNEEIIVALCFLSFVAFSLSYFGNVVKESLDERSSLIRFSAENYHRLKEEALQSLLSQHKVLGKLKKVFPQVGRFTQDTLSLMSASDKMKINLYNRFSQSVQEKLSYFHNSKTLLQQALQESIASTIPHLVFITLKQNKTGKKSLSNKMIVTQIRDGLKSLKI